MEIQHDDCFYEVHALPVFDKDHEVTGILEFYRDISDRKHYEQELQQADKLASLGQLVSGSGTRSTTRTSSFAATSRS